MAVLGVDGCPQGWFAVRLNDNAWRVRAYPNITELWAAERDCELILIDIPVGLPNRDMPRRNCDGEARTLLGFPRRSSVFSPPGLAAFNAGTHPGASEANRNEIGVGLSIQSWAILPKIQEVDDFLIINNPARNIIRECHPELCFWGLSGLAFGEQNAVDANKKTPEGRKVRMEILRQLDPLALADDILIYAKRRYLRRDVARDDIIDAMAAAFTARLRPGGLAALPNIAERQVDEHDLPMEMVYPMQPQ
jgi:predicted RNase H-like nuclease